MPEYAVPPAGPVALPVEGSALLFPVRRVYCVGRNYAAHAVEMGHDPDREPPFFFQKNPDNLDPSGVFPYPSQSDDVHHEIELVVALGRGGTNIPPAEALDCVWGYGLGLDMTRRDLQGAAKAVGRPWEIGKAFERSAPIAPLRAVAATGHLAEGPIELRVNGALRQQGDLGQMIWKTPEIIAVLSEFFELAAGDVIMTGTPSGVGPVARGDLMEGRAHGLGGLSVRVV